MGHCANCGAPLPPGAGYCPRCGANLSAAPPATLPPAPPPTVHRSVWWWLVPLAVVAVGGIVFLLLLGLPFGREGDRPPRVATETVAEEGPAASERSRPAETATIVDVEDEPAIATPRRPAPRKEITQSEAESALRSYLASSNYYQLDAGCIGASTTEYRNAGYTIDVRDSCGSRPLGRWRVDSKTREIFRQRPDGRYLRP